MTEKERNTFQDYCDRCQQAQTGILWWSCIAALLIGVMLGALALGAVCHWFKIPL